MSRGPTRRELLAVGASVATAGAAAPLIGAAAAGAASGESEAMRLERLLRVELLLLFSYQHVLGFSMLTPNSKSVLTQLRAHEEAHIHALSVRLTALGGALPPPPVDVKQANFDLAHRRVKGRLGQLQSARDALHLLLDLERVVIGAYFVALIKLQDPRLIMLIAQIMASEAQHEAIVGELLYGADTQKAVPYGLVQGVQ